MDPAVVLRMRDTLVHRGPDGEGLWVSPDRRVALGHRRLSIIDIAHGAQPMATADEAIVLAYNGEVYNHAALRRELESRGHRFRTRCDTEVVLTAYAEFGEQCLERLDGMFAFVIWDARRSALFFARDRVGKKPLYYTSTRYGWAFASEIKALLEHPEVSRSVDQGALAHYLSFLATPSPKTLFSGILKLAAGHCGTWTANSGLNVSRWWRVPRGERLAVSTGEAAGTVRALFEAAVEKRMMSDVPFGAYLSGGIDSSANVAIMSQFTDEPVRTLSIAFADEPGLNELAPARAAAQELGTDHHEFVIGDSDVLALLPALIHHQDEPIADPVCVPLFHLARSTKALGITVVQVGEGSDEAFFGYPGYTQALQTADRLRRMRRLLPRAILRPAVRVALHRRPLGRELLLEALGHGFPSARRVAGFSESAKRGLLSAGSTGTAYDFLRALVGSALTDEEIADITLDHELALRLPELLLMRVDKMTMAASVEARAPFLDTALIEYAARLPLGLRWQNGQGKLVLKEAMAGVLPQAILTRRKQGFGAPVWRWATSFRSLLEREVDREALHEYLDPAAVRRLVTHGDPKTQAFPLWILLNFALWHRHWIEGDDLSEIIPRALAAA